MQSSKPWGVSTVPLFLESKLSCSALPGDVAEEFCGSKQDTSEFVDLDEVPILLPILHSELRLLEVSLFLPRQEEHRKKKSDDERKHQRHRAASKLTGVEDGDDDGDVDSPADP